MSDALREKISGLRIRARFALILHGIGWGLTIAIVILLCTALVDFYLRQDNRFSRIALSLAVLLAIVLVALRFVLPLLRRRMTDVALAQRIQNRFPKLQNKVASAVEFSKQQDDDGLAGSAAMRQAVIDEANSELTQVPIAEVVRYRTAVTAGIAAAVSLAVVLAFALFTPTGSSIALARLTNPFGNTVWPKLNQLVFRNPPTHLPSGGLFEVEVIDQKNQLPETVAIEYQFEDESETKIVREPMKFVDGIMVAQRNNVRQSFLYRAVGGDDETIWHSLTMVIPPRVETLRAEVRPPTYSGWPTVTSSGQILSLSGSTVQLTGKANKPIAAAVLETAAGTPLPIETEGSGFNLSHEGASPWVPQESATYSLRLTDRNGIVGGGDDRWQLRVIADEPPTVNIEKPQIQLQASRDATVPVQVLVKDGLAIRDISIQYTRSDRQTKRPESIRLFEGPPQAPPLSAAALEMHLAKGDRQLARYEWNLAPLELVPGTEITFYVSAHDYQPAEGTSKPNHTITIVTKDAIAEQLAIRQQTMLSELSRVLGREKDSRGQTAELEIQLEEVGRLDEKELQKLRGVELTEREIRRRLGNENDSIMENVTAILEEIKNNHIDRPEMARQLTNLRQVLQRVEVDHLKPLEQELTRARKFAQVDSTIGNPIAATPQASTPKRPENQHRGAAEALKQAGKHQEQVIAALEQPLDNLLRWDQYRRSVRGLAGIEQRQRRLRDETQSLRDRLLGQELAELESRQRADVKKMAERQREVTRNMDRALEKMQQAGRELRGTDPLAAASIREALKHARQAGIGNEMLSASQHIDQNQLGQAAAQQAEAGKHLQEMIDILEHRDDPQLVQLVEKLRKAESELDRLAQAHRKLKEGLEQALARSDQKAREAQLEKLDKNRSQLEDKIRSLANRLERLKASQAAGSLATAADRSEQAGKAAQEGDRSASRQEDGEAQDQIEQARQQLAQARKRAEAELLNQQLARLPDQIRSLIERQTALQEKTGELHRARDTTEQLSRPEKARAVGLSQQQLELATGTEQLAEELDSVEVFQRAMAGVLENMQQASEALVQFQTGMRTQSIQKRAISMLGLMLTALAKDKAERDGEKQGGGGGGGQGGGKGQGGKQRSLSEIKLLKLLQEDLNVRVMQNQTKIDEATRAGIDIAPLLLERGRLATEQGELASWTFDLLATDPQDGSREP